MNNKKTDTHANINRSRKEQLIDRCLKMGMPVVGDEDEETLQMYIKMANDIDKDEIGFGYFDLKRTVKSDVSFNSKGMTILGKLVSLFM